MPTPVVFQTAVKPYSFVSAPPGSPEPRRVFQAGDNAVVVGIAGQSVGPPGKGGVVFDGSDGRVPLTLSPDAPRAVRRGDYVRAGADGFAVPAEFPTPENRGRDNVGAWVHEGGSPGDRIVVEFFAAGPAA